MLSCGPSEYRHGRQKLINHYICVIWVERFQNKNKMLHENCSLCPYKAILRFETTRHFKSEMNWCLYIINSKFIWCFSLIYINDYIYIYSKKFLICVHNIIDFMFFKNLQIQAMIDLRFFLMPVKYFAI